MPKQRKDTPKPDNKTAKPKVAFYWCASCGGCEETIVDLAEDILKVVDALDIALWPVALDVKLKDVAAWRPGEVAVVFINGAVRLSEQEEWVKLLREKMFDRRGLWRLCPPGRHSRPGQRHHARHHHGQ